MSIAPHTSAEQKARDMLERIGVKEAQQFSAGNLVELANLIASASVDKSALLALLEQVEFVLAVTTPMTAQQEEVWPELRQRAKAARATSTGPTVNTLVAGLDENGERMTSTAPSCWEFCPGGMRLLGEVAMDVFRSGRPCAVEILTVAGEHVYSMKLATPSSSTGNGGIFTLMAGRIDFGAAESR